MHETQTIFRKTINRNHKNGVQNIKFAEKSSNKSNLCTINIKTINHSSEKLCFNNKTCFHVSAVMEEPFDVLGFVGRFLLAVFSDVFSSFVVSFLTFFKCFAFNILRHDISKFCSPPGRGDQHNQTSGR